MIVHANLDCEARWAGLTLPLAVQQRISLYGALCLALVPKASAVELWTPQPIDPARLVGPLVEGGRPELRVGEPAHAQVRWADPAAKAENDRRLALELADGLGARLPGARAIATLDELADVHGPWVCKAPWTAAGRDRCHGDGPPTAEQRTRITRLLERFGGLVFEPWMERLLDVGVCATVAPDGAVIAEPPHGLEVDGRGRFLGISLRPPALDARELAQLAGAVTAAGRALAERGFTGPFAIDAFAYRSGTERRFHPLCEINARRTFGWIARALGRRLAISRLGFGEAPPGATPLIAPGPDGVTAWCA